MTESGRWTGAATNPPASRSGQPDHGASRSCHRRPSRPSPALSTATEHGGAFHRHRVARKGSPETINANTSKFGPSALTAHTAASSTQHDLRRRMPDQPRTPDLRGPGHRTLDHHHQNNPRVPRRTGLLSSLTPCVAESHRTRQRDRIAGSLRRHRNRGPRVHRSRADGFAIQHSGEPRPSPAPG
jgi:hypothetical protein